MYIPSLLLIITLYLTCDERKTWSNIKKSQNIMAMIVDLNQDILARIDFY